MNKPKFSKQRLSFRTIDSDIRLLQQQAKSHGEKPSKYLRMVLRQALSKGPQFFHQDVVALRELAKEISAVGRNLNQLVRQGHQGKPVPIHELEPVLLGLHVSTLRVHQELTRLVSANQI